MFLCIISIILLQNCSFAASSKHTNLLKLKNENEYLIYVNNLLEKEFSFAFSKTSNTDKNELAFISSAKDKEDGNNVAFIDNDLFINYFQESGTTYFWAKNGDTYVVEAEKIDINSTIQDEEIQSLNSITKKIKVKFGEKKESKQTQEGVTTSYTVGTIEIDDNNAADYYYHLIKVDNEDEFVKLAEEMNSVDSKDMFNKLSIYNNLKNSYNNVLPSVDSLNWIKVEDFTILQPQGAKSGDKYLVWIKQSINGTDVIDVQIMTCKREENQEFEEKTTVIKQVSKLPVTYDSAVLFVIAGILLLLITGLAVYKFKFCNKEK